jgi:hypothetical protein
MRRPDSRFLQLRDGESRNEAGIIRAEEAHIFSLRGVMLVSHLPHLSTPDARQSPSLAVRVRVGH